jgi:hypothetical protein
MRPQVDIGGFGAQAYPRDMLAIILNPAVDRSFFQLGTMTRKDFSRHLTSTFLVRPPQGGLYGFCDTLDLA